MSKTNAMMKMASLVFRPQRDEVESRLFELIKLAASPKDVMDAMKAWSKARAGAAVKPAPVVPRPVPAAPKPAPVPAAAPKPAPKPVPVPAPAPKPPVIRTPYGSQSRSPFRLLRPNRQ